MIWSYLRPDDRLHWERIGIVRHPEHGERRSEALALAQLLIVVASRRSARWRVRAVENRVR